MDPELGLGEPTAAAMNRVPVYEVIDQRSVVQDGESTTTGRRSVFRPLTGDECTVSLTDVQLSADCDCSCSAVFGGEAVAQDEIRRVLVHGEADCAVDRGLEAVLSGTRPGELRQFCLGDGRGGRVSGRVRLLGVRKCAGGAGWRGDDRLKLAEAVRHKDAGNRLYGQGRYADAFHRFNRSIRAVLFVRNPDAVRSARNALYTAICNNMAACQLQLGNYEHARRLSGKALAVDPNNLKALVRRCRASAELRIFDDALTDARLALDHDPGNAVAKHYLDVAARGIDSQNANYKDMVKKMFA